MTYDRGSGRDRRQTGKGRTDVGGSSTISHAMAVLRTFTPESPSRGVTEIAAEVGLHKSSVSRILAALEREEVVEQDSETRRFRLGLGLIAVAGPLLADLDVRRAAHPVMLELAEQVGETVALSVWDGRAAVTVEQIPSSAHVKHTSALGSRYYSTADSTIQSFLAHGAADPQVLLDSTALEVSPAMPRGDFMVRLSEVRSRGVSVNRAETAAHEVGISAPVFDHTGAVTAVLLIAAPSYRIDNEVCHRLEGECRRSAEQISARLGYVESR